MRITLAIALLLFYSFSFAQVSVKKLDKASIPKTFKYSGILKNAVTWKDSSGTHYVITTETGNVASKVEPEAGNHDADLFAYHYLSTKDSLRLTWKVFDFIKDCPVDLDASFIKNSFAVTDLNKDGQAEVWLMYKTACRGDVSPSDMKIIMYEKDKKYAVRGTNKVKVSEKEYYGGEYTYDAAFKSAPEVFRSYAKTLWQKNIMETWD